MKTVQFPQEYFEARDHAIKRFEEAELHVTQDNLATVHALRGLAGAILTGAALISSAIMHGKENS